VIEQHYSVRVGASLDLQLLKPVEEVLEGSDLRLGFDDLGEIVITHQLLYDVKIANLNLGVATG